MNEILKPALGADQHPDETQLLLALERELSPEETAEIERHIGACWECRARYHEMQQGILAFVEYREKVYLPELESAPGNFHQFPSLLNTTAEESRKVGFSDRIRDRFSSLFSLIQMPVQVKWVSVTAAIMAAVILWTQVLDPATLSASELLTKAAQAQNPPAVHRKVRQKIRVKTATTAVENEFEWETGNAIPNAKWGSDPDNWTAPLTAEGFAEWHDSLSRPKDKVKKSGDNWTLDTIAPAGPIKEASIVIRRSDFQPTEEHIRFSDDRRLDVEEVTFDMAAEAGTPAPTIAQATRPAAPSVTPRSQQPAAPSPVNLEEAELELRYAMFTQHWDDDEDLQITRTTDAVVLSGTASSAERARMMQAALGSLPGIRLAISPPGLARRGSRGTTSQRTPAPSSTPLLKDRLDSSFATVAARRDFVDSSLSAADTALSHAFALKKLAERYTDAERSSLKTESQARLDEMLQAHLRQLAAANTTLNGLLDLLPPSQPSQPATVARGEIPVLFDLVQRQDSLVAALVAGTQTTDTLATASAGLRASHEAISRIAGELVRK